jgi:hypothetical protein
MRIVVGYEGFVNSEGVVCRTIICSYPVPFSQAAPRCKYKVLCGEWVALIHMSGIDLAVYRASVSCNYGTVELWARSLKNKARGREAPENTHLHSAELDS